jgi:predicted membrane chloride channel (bestrophin family)
VEIDANYCDFGTILRKIFERILNSFDFSVIIIIVKVNIVMEINVIGIQL